VAYYAELQEAGRIESFDVLLLQPNGSWTAAWWRGSHAQLDAVAEDERFRRLMSTPR